MNSCTAGIVRNCWATAMPRIRSAIASGTAHKTLIQRLPSRMRGTTPSCGGSQSFRRRRSSAVLKLVASCGCGAWRGSFARAAAVMRASLSVSILPFISAALTYVSLTRCGVAETQDYDLPRHNFRWPKNRRKAGRYSNSLDTVCGIGDHTAADRAADLPAPSPLTVGGIDRIEVAAHIAE